MARGALKRSRGTHRRRRDRRGRADGRDAPQSRSAWCASHWSHRSRVLSARRSTSRATAKACGGNRWCVRSKACSSCSTEDNGGMAAVRPAAVAGMFYPGNARALADEVDELLGGVEALAPRVGFPEGADRAARRLHLFRRRWRRAPTTRCAPRAASSGAWCCSARCIAWRCAGSRLPSDEAFATPLGSIPIDREALRFARGPAAGGDQRRGARARAFARGAAAVPAEDARRRSALVPFAVGAASVAEVARGDRAPVGRAGDADRHLDRPLALPRLRRGARASTARPSRASPASPPTSTTRKPAARRR